MAEFGKMVESYAAEWVREHHGRWTTYAKPITRSEMEVAFMAGVIYGMERASATLNERTSVLATEETPS